MLINADHPEECRAVILNNGKLEDYIVEHTSQELVKGNIYLGVITRVEPAIEAAFVDFGGKKYGFLPFKDVLKESYIPSREKKAKTRIQDVLLRGQKILVQVVKESRDAKGPSLSNAITIPGRCLVLTGSSDSTGISRKIEDESERKKLKEIVSQLGLPDNLGVIIRTAGLGRTKIELQKDLQMLIKIWESIQEKIKNPEAKAPLLLHEGPDMVVRTVRDQFTGDTNEIIVDNFQSYKAVKEFIRLVMPRMRHRVKYYQESRPLFSYYNVEHQIESIFNRQVPLPSGGSIVIDIGEAMVAIDVNSGKTTSASELEETAVKTNLEAAEEIAHQLRLRDLGGLIVIDFIDMFQKKNKSLVEKKLKQSCKIDKARVNISRISRFGLMEMSRQRLSPPVKEGVFEPCSRCSGTGHIQTVSTIALSVLRKIQEKLAAESIKVLEIIISSPVASYLLNNKLQYLKEFQEKQGVTLQFKSKDHLPVEQFSYIVLEKKKEEEIQAEKLIKNEEPEKKEVVESRSSEKTEKRGRGRRPATYRGKSSRKSTNTRRTGGDARRRTRKPTRTTRAPQKRESEAISEVPVGESSRPLESVSNSPDSRESKVIVETFKENPNEMTEVLPAKDTQEIQPVENVSKIHETVTQDLPFKSEVADEDDASTNL